MYRHVPTWLAPELGSGPYTGVVDLHDRLDVEGDRVLDALAGRFESVFDTVYCALGSGWDFVMDIVGRSEGARIEMSAHIPSELDEDFLQYVGDVLELDIRNMRTCWMFRDGSWQLDAAQTGFVATDGTVETASLGTLCAEMEIAAAHCACAGGDTSKQWHSGGATTPCRCFLPSP